MCILQTPIFISHQDLFPECQTSLQRILMASCTNLLILILTLGFLRQDRLLFYLSNSVSNFILPVVHAKHLGVFLAPVFLSHSFVWSISTFCRLSFWLHSQPDHLSPLLWSSARIITISCLYYCSSLLQDHPTSNLIPYILFSSSLLTLQSFWVPFFDYEFPVASTLTWDDIWSPCQEQ